MATYLWSTLVNGQVIAPFDPANDVLRFDVGSAAAVEVTNTGPGSTSFAMGGKSISVATNLFTFTTSNVTFSNGTMLVVGDNTIGTANDDAGVVLVGSDGNDQLIGGAGADSLDGGLGFDVMEGGAGNDSYVVNSSADQVIEAAGAGIDTVHATGTPYTLAANLEVLILEAGVSSGTGNDLDNELYGNAINNFLNGGAGNDHMEGGGANDTYTVDSAGDVVVEQPNEGVNDIVMSSVTYVLPDNVEVLRLASGGGSINGTGSGSDNQISGNDSVNVIDGLDGNDVLRGVGGDDTLHGGAGNDIVAGDGGADVLDGGSDFDIAEYFNRVTASLADPSANTGDAAGDTYISIEGLKGFGTLIGNGGANTLIVKDAPQGSSLEGGGGNDTLTGFTANDTLNGGTGADTLNGGSGTDYAVFTSASAGVIADLVSGGTGGEAAGDTYASIEGFKGSDFGDQLFGDAQVNDLAGAGGNDTLDGRAGNDTLDGGAGDDTLRGGDGTDVLTGGTGADRHEGGAGTDTARYETALAAVLANLTTPAQNTGDAAGDTYFSIENVTGSAFNDTLVGDGADNNIQGLAGNDTLQGRAGNDTLNGGFGNDYLDGGAGADALAGDFGTDYAKYSYATAGLIVDLATPASNTGEAAGDTFTSIEGAIGTQYDDTVRGNSSANDLLGADGNDQIFGRAGNDNLQGMNGNDQLNGGAGADRLNGAAGTDYARYDDAASGLIANLASVGQNTGDAAGDAYISIEGLVGSLFNDTLIGDDNANDLQGLDGNDYLQARGGNDTLQGGLGGDQLEGGAGADTLIGGDGFDYAKYTYAPTAVIVDMAGAQYNTGDAVGDSMSSIEGIMGSAFNDQLRGDTIANDLVGLDGDDFLLGRGGDDNLQGMNGADNLNGGVGEDRLLGGAGNDVFAFDRGTAQGDRVVDFAGNGAAAGDQLVFLGYGTASAGATFTQINATDWSINSSDGLVHETISLLNAAAVAAGDYVFI